MAIERTDVEISLSDDRRTLTIKPVDAVKDNSSYWIYVVGAKKYEEPEEEITPPESTPSEEGGATAPSGGAEAVPMLLSIEAPLSATDIDESEFFKDFPELAMNAIDSRNIISKQKISVADGYITPFSVKIKTALSPLYCTLESLKMIVDTFGIPEENMISYIHIASQEADFISGGTADETDFAVQEFVRTKAAYDCLLRTYMDRMYMGGGSEYTLDLITYKDSLNTAAFRNLLDDLKKALQKWQDAIRGYYNEGRVKPKATRIGLKSSQNSDVSFTTFDSIMQDISRNSPQWS